MIRVFQLLILCFLSAFTFHAEFSMAAVTNNAEEKVSVDISLYNIKIDALFRGQEISLYGAVDNYPVDIVISFTGPHRDMLVLEKKRKWNLLWVDGENLHFKNVPSFFALLSNRDIKLIAPAELLDRLNLNVQKFKIEVDESTQKRSNLTSDSYRKIYLDVGKQRQIVQYHSDGVKFLSGNMLFRANLSLPSYIVSGDYVVNVYIFKYGRLLGQKQLEFDVSKTSVQHAISNTAKNQSLLYAFLSILFIWLFSFLLHRFVRRLF